MPLSYLELAAMLVEGAVQYELTGAERQVLAAYMKTLGKRLLRAEFEAALEMEGSR